MLRSWSPRARWLAVAVIAVMLVGALLLASDALQSREVQLSSFQRTGDSRAIVVTVVMGIGEEVIGTSAVEDANVVRVTVRVRRYTGSVPAVGVLMPATVRLGAPLRDRTVVDAAGRPVTDLGDYVPPRPTPTR